MVLSAFIHYEQKLWLCHSALCKAIYFTWESQRELDWKLAWPPHTATWDNIAHYRGVYESSEFMESFIEIHSNIVTNTLCNAFSYISPSY